MAIKKQEIIEALKKVVDPELNIDIWTLKLVYNIDIKKENINIRMTFTSPFCPYGPMLLEDVKQKVKAVKPVKKVDIEVVFDPPWEPPEELKTMYGV